MLIRPLPGLSWLSLVCALSSAGCATPRLVTDPAPASCRSVIGADRRPAAVAVRWHAPADASDRRALAAWCDTVGPIIVERPAEASPLRLDAIDSLAVVSWNIHVGGGDLVRFVEALRRGTLSGGEPIPHFVLLLQETYRAGGEIPSRVSAGLDVPDRIDASPPDAARRDIVSAAAELGLSLYYAPSMRNGFGDGAPEDRGNAILSTLPLTDLAAVELPFERQRRVALAATLNGAVAGGVRWTLRVSSAHLDTMAGPRSLWLFASAARARQAQGLVESFAGEEAVVLGGDLNTWSEGPREAAYRELRRWFRQTPAPEARPTFRWGLLLDYLLFRLPDGWSGEYRRIDDRFGSDHHPLLGWVRVGGDLLAAANGKAKALPHRRKA